MSWDEVGKSAKRMGMMHHRQVRRIDPTPPPPKVPGAARAKKIRKNFGFTYQYRYASPTGSKWRTQKPWSWYATEKQRDDAMRNAGHVRSGWCEIRNVTPVTRDYLRDNSNAAQGVK